MAESNPSKPGVTAEKCTQPLNIDSNEVSSENIVVVLIISDFIVHFLVSRENSHNFLAQLHQVLSQYNRKGRIDSHGSDLDHEVSAYPYGKIDPDFSNVRIKAFNALNKLLSQKIIKAYNGFDPLKLKVM